MARAGLPLGTFLAGPLVWSATFLMRYLLVPSVGGTRAWLHVTILAAMAIVVAAGLAAFARARALGDDGAPGERFLARAAVAMNAFFFVVLVAEAIPAFVLRPGD
jgi:hypothetical protein